MNAKAISAAIVTCLGFATAANAAVVGAGTGIPLEVVDTPGGGPRTNIELSVTTTLDPGTYQATTFSYAAGQAGDATPFLAVLTGVHEYSVLAVGNLVNIPGTETQTVGFGGSDTFTLAAVTTIFGGFTNSPTSDNPIFLDNGTGPFTDHDGTPDPVSVGGTITGISNVDLGRQYAFSIEVQQIPEPSGTMLLALACSAVFALRRRR